LNRRWLDALVKGDRNEGDAPTAWRRWIKSGTYVPLVSPRTRDFRTQADQAPETAEGRQIIQLVWRHFEDDPYRFEELAGRLWLMEARDVTYELTQRSVDGGRDATGELVIGPRGDPIRLDFALEAKCYEPLAHGVGVRDTSRLISRLRYRQFGVLVTTSFVNRQAYEELRQDKHPVVVMCARDIVGRPRSAWV